LINHYNFSKDQTKEVCAKMYAKPPLCCWGGLIWLRMIQLYEQRVNDINKASAIVLYKLSISLKVDMRELLETKTLITRD
jgi:hypothetical protein